RSQCGHAFTRRGSRSSPGSSKANDPRSHRAGRCHEPVGVTGSPAMQDCRTSVFRRTFHRGNGRDCRGFPCHRETRMGHGALVAAPDHDRIRRAMNPERWQKVKHALAEAMEAGPAERDACLEKSCAGDASLRHEVEVLLQHEIGASSRFLNETALAEVSATLLDAQQSRAIGRHFGAYKTV